MGALRCASVCVSFRCVSARLPVERRVDDQRLGRTTQAIGQQHTSRAGSAPFCEHAPPRSSAEAATAPPLAPLAHEHEDSPAGTERRRQTARCELYGPLLSGVGMRVARFAGVMSRSFALILNLCAHILTRCPSWCGLACMFSFSAAEQAELPGRNQVVVSLREEQ